MIYFRRVLPEMVAVLDSTIGSAPRVAKEPEKPVAPVVDTSQVAALLADVEKRTQEAAYWEERFNKACDAFPDQQAQYWRAKHNKLLAEMEQKNGSAQWAQ